MDELVNVLLRFAESRDTEDADSEGVFASMCTLAAVLIKNNEFDELEELADNFISFANTLEKEKNGT